MVLVRLIDLLVIGLQIMGGRREANPILRLGLWVALLSLVILAIAGVAGLLVLLQYWLDHVVGAPW